MHTVLRVKQVDGLAGCGEPVVSGLAHSRLLRPGVRLLRQVLPAPASRSPTVRPALPPRAWTRWQLELACGWMAAGVEAATEGRTAAVRTKTEGMVSKPFMTWSQVGGPRMRFGTAATVATDNPCLHLGTVETPVHPRHPFTPCCLVAFSVQVAELQEAGWEIGAHTVNHRKIADQHAEEGSLALQCHTVYRMTFQ